MFKVFYTNCDGDVIFNKDRLTEILDEVYNEGFKDGQRSKTYTWTSPYSYPYKPNITWTSSTADSKLPKGNYTVSDSGNITSASCDGGCNCNDK